MECFETLLRAGAHGNTWASVGPTRVQNQERKCSIFLCAVTAQLKLEILVITQCIPKSHILASITYIYHMTWHL